jgi:tetratricopeptide (TPR) repeat protein
MLLSSPVLPYPSRFFAWVLGCALLFVASAHPLYGSPPHNTPSLETKLRQRIAEQPEDGAGWRLLGRHLLQQHRLMEARAALEQAVRLSPHSAAAHYDLGRTLDELGEASAAAEAYRTAGELAPDSEYARAAGTSLERLEATPNPVSLADYRIRRFDGAEATDRIDEFAVPQAPWWRDRLTGRVETGVLYNSNVALAPLSRQLAPGTRQSLQAFVAPEMAFAIVDEQLWRSGPTLGGHFTLNESNFQQFNLQSYRPGWFTEFYLFRGQQAFVPRVAYEFTHDEFDGQTLGNRHALLSSLATYWDDVHASVVYWSIDHSNFINDGILPAVTSQDGWTNAVGISHDILLPSHVCRVIRGGVELSRADTTGTDFTYNGISLFAAGVFPIQPGLDFTLHGSWGYRDYPDFEFTPSRNEHIWRGGAELRKHFNEQLSAAAVFNFDRFNSQNPLFDAQRYVTGIVLTYRF